MKIALAKIKLKPTEEGGKSVSMGNGGDYSCPVFFTNVVGLSDRGYDCRLLLKRVEVTIAPGQTVENVPLAFLSPEEVFPCLRIGIVFKLWEGGEIGEGEITALPGVDSRVK